MSADPVAEPAAWKSAYEAAEAFFNDVNWPDELWTDSREAFASGAAAYRDRLRRVLYEGVTADGTLVVQRATWILAEPPGPEVTHLTDSEGETWIRHDPDGEMWADPKDKEFLQVPWSILLAEYGPLTDSTPVGDAA